MHHTCYQIFVNSNCQQEESRKIQISIQMMIDTTRASSMSSAPSTHWCYLWYFYICVFFNHSMAVGNDHRPAAICPAFFNEAFWKTRSRFTLMTLGVLPPACTGLPTRVSVVPDSLPFSSILSKALPHWCSFLAFCLMNSISWTFFSFVCIKKKTCLCHLYQKWSWQS